MTKVRLAVMLGFALSFAAGASVGLLASLPKPAEADRPRHGPDLAKQLGLSDEQRSEMNRIWGEFVMSRDREFRDAKREIWQAKDEAIENLLTEPQREEYDAILAECDLRMADMDAQWRAVIDQAVEKTKAILTPEQIKKYEQFRAARHARRPRGGRGRSRRGPDHGPAPHGSPPPGAPPDAPNAPGGDQ